MWIYDFSFCICYCVPFLGKAYYTVNGKVASDAKKLEFVTSTKGSIFTPIDRTSAPAGALEAPVTQKTDPESVKDNNGNIELVHLTVPVAPTDVSEECFLFLEIIF